MPSFLQKHPPWDENGNEEYSAEKIHNSITDGAVGLAVKMHESHAGTERHGQKPERETDLAGVDSIGEQECESKGPAERSDESEGAVSGCESFALPGVN